MKTILDESTQRLSRIVSDDISSGMSRFFKHRCHSVRTTIEARHAKKFTNLSKETDTDQSTPINKDNWVVNLSNKPLSSDERSILEKGPKFAPTPRKIPTKDIVAEVEAAIVRLPDDTKDAIRTSTASILHRASLPLHNNISKAERKALQSLKEDDSRLIMKADKGNCFVVMDRSDYNKKMEVLLSDHLTYQLVQEYPFAKIERELNHRLLDLKKKKKIDESTYRKLRSTDAVLPAIRGSIKHHKPGYLPYVGWALYNTSNFLTDILVPIQNCNGYSVSNSLEFADQVASLEISNHEAMVSCDVVPLFTAIPVEKACEYIRKKLKEDTTLHLGTNLTIDEMISLLDFTLSNNYFVYNDSIYKQVHGCAMGSPVSPVVANLCMEIIEESAITASATPPKVWKRYVDDGLVIIKKHSVSAFHVSIHPKFSFTIETENNGQISFLDTLVSRKDGVLTTDVYRKSTHTDRKLDFCSHYEK